MAVAAVTEDMRRVAEEMPDENEDVDEDQTEDEDAELEEEGDDGVESVPADQDEEEAEEAEVEEDSDEDVDEEVGKKDVDIKLEDEDEAVEISEDDSEGSASPAPERDPTTVAGFMNKLAPHAGNMNPGSVASLVTAALLEHQGNNHTNQLDDILDAGEKIDDRVCLLARTLEDLKQAQKRQFDEMQRTQKEQFHALMQQVYSTWASLDHRIAAMEQVVGSGIVHVNVTKHQTNHQGMGLHPVVMQQQGPPPPANFLHLPPFQR